MGTVNVEISGFSVEMQMGYWRFTGNVASK